MRVREVLARPWVGICCAPCFKFVLLIGARSGNSGGKNDFFLNDWPIFVVSIFG